MRPDEPLFRSTYRLQLTPEFGFAAARELVPYLRDLGISHLYLSPSLQAREGSQHGYDVIDPRRISDALGGEEEFRKLAGAGLGVILDIVPNHMAAVDESPFWRDLELRQMFFDVDLKTGFHRRFFDVGELGGLKQEDWEVFWTTHAKVIELVREGVIEGVRVDHPDGLADPAEYFERLADAGVEHVWAEKILEPGEELRDWPVEGTTGYEFLNDVLALCVNADAEQPLTELYETFTGDTRRYEDIVALSKLEVAVNTFEPELRRLHLEVATENLPLALASFHVYRTYIQPYKGVIEEADREEIGRASVSEELRRLLFLQEPGHEDFVVRFQQVTGPVMAKGVEDTAFYRHFRLAALNEVGGNPGRFGMSVDEFHEANAKRAARFPRHLLTTYTHDTKRSPDVRSRIAAISWLPEEWAERVGAWHAQLGGLDDPHEELLVYQTLVGALPIERERLDGYLEKALREGKVNTNWLTPNEEHERAVQAYAWRAAELIAKDPFLERVRDLGLRLSLAQLLLKLTAPGVPDVYRGDELEDLSFAGSYEAVDAGEGVCAFVRGGEVLVAAAVRPDATVRVPEGWHDVLGVEGLALGVRPAREVLVGVV
jgi:(1->4)-alpha-D-glucan 1-alpha-D-glucosylmutase